MMDSLRGRGKQAMRWSSFLGLVAWLVAGEAARGHAQTGSLVGPPRIFGDYTQLVRRSWEDADATPESSTPRLQFFQMPSGFLTTPLGLQSDDEDGKGADDEPGILHLSYGAQIPYIDMPVKGAPGGLGYYRIQSQLQLLDLGVTCVSAVVQAVTPMGTQFGGVSNGMTVVSPSLAWFHDLGSGTALHGFVGQNLTSTASWRDQLDANFRCGMAIQQPVPLPTNHGEKGLFVFVQALGQYRSDFSSSDNRGPTWDIIPGLQYRLNSGCWMSLGLSRYNFFTCTWQY